MFGQLRFYASPTDIASSRTVRGKMKCETYPREEFCESSFGSE